MAPGGGFFGHMATTPATVTETFKRETVATLLGDPNMRASLVACPEGSGQCEKFAGTSQGHALSATYNTQGQLIALRMDEANMTFEYNAKTDDIPPSWDTGPVPSRGKRGREPNS
jgi:hypothetical protein